MPANLKKHDRLERLQKMLSEPQASMCHPGGVEPQGPFAIDEYEGAPLVPARARPFKEWFEKFVGPWPSPEDELCWNGVMRTTRESIHRRPRGYYMNLLRELEEHNDMEAVHYMERSMRAVF